MKKITKQQFAHARSWILRHARPLEAARFQYHFHNGSQQDVLRALAHYQNEDGGFGNALEPDNWDPHSSPYTTLKAIQLMKDVGFTDVSHPLYQGAVDYLRSGGFAPQEGWPFAMPTSVSYPHAPWWTYSEDRNTLESPGLSAQIAAFALSACQPEDGLYQKARNAARHALDSLMSGQLRGEMGVAGCAMLLPHCLKLDTPCSQNDIQKALKTAVDAAIVRDPARWHTHVPRPSAFIPSPDSSFLPGNEAAVGLELDWLIDTLPPHDLWSIDWSWFDNNAKYPSEFAISEMWWKCWCGIDKLLFLRAFGRMA